MPHDDAGSTRRPPPRGWLRLAARAPVLLFRVGLGPLLGKRFLLLHHLGRVSGRNRLVVLEVVTYDPDRHTWTVASGFGTGADWYRNLRKQPKTLIQQGNHRHAVTARFLPPEAGATIMEEYARRRPRIARRLCAFLGLPADGSSEALRRAGSVIPFVLLETEPGTGTVAGRPHDGEGR